MRCDEIDALVQQRLDDRKPLDFGGEPAIADHLRHCATCRAMVASLAQGLTALRTGDAELPRVDLADRVLAAWRHGNDLPSLVELRKPSPVRRVLWLAGAAIAAAVVAMATLEFGPGNNRPEVVQVRPVEPVVVAAPRHDAAPAQGEPVGNALAAVWRLVPTVGESDGSPAAAVATTTAEWEDEVLTSLSPVTHSTVEALGSLRRLLPAVKEQEPRS